MRMYIPLLKKNGVKINGTPRYIGIHVSFDDFSKIEIGNNTTISDECHLLTHDYHQCFSCNGQDIKQGHSFSPWYKDR